MGPPPAKRARGVEPTSLHTALPEELQKGVVVLYNGGVRGVVHEAYAPIDEFWITDQASGELVRDEDGAAMVFRSKDLQLESAPDPSRARAVSSFASASFGDSSASSAAAAGGGADSAVRVLLIGPEHVMLEIIKNFGMPDVSERRDPSQQVLAVPCTSCECGKLCSPFDPWSCEMCDDGTCPLTKVASEGVEEGIVALAKRLRPDIEVRVRPYHLKQAIDQIGPDLRKLKGLYCLSAVTVPFGQDEIDAVDGQERRWREQVRCQIDLGVSADGVAEASESAIEDTARRVLAESCGVRLSDELWAEASQFRLRQHLGVDLPLKFFDGTKTEVFVIIVPENTEVDVEAELLRFSAELPAAPAAVAAAAPTPQALPAGGKDEASWSIPDWIANQDQFKDLPKLPEGWIRVRSKRNREIYYWDTRNNKPTYEMPLPDGWTKQISKSTGKVYYFNAMKRQSMYTVPTE